MEAAFTFSDFKKGRPDHSGERGRFLDYGYVIAKKAFGRCGAVEGDFQTDRPGV